MAKVTGIGGVFFKGRGDGEALAAWHRQRMDPDGNKVELCEPKPWAARDAGGALQP
ncbi:hypothetical protein [Luteimonas sp. MC1825]|uniref:hypothetical protein n=1 Tax=Luteimonas sp. MC1825 TaxID=2761107 RepID=UPI001608BDB0|nr:hypothetical protein [Luteimonas sp. MC1825]MBB6598225.1 hypothetical protein [Luteimonas sp. MC1825]QOC88444.1 hypothetical protein IDM46_01350 [Luteimonas sp. MC1825]